MKKDEVKIVSGGQTGVDRGALQAAMDLGLDWGGWAPKGWRAENGTIPPLWRCNGLAEEFGEAVLDGSERHICILSRRALHAMRPVMQPGVCSRERGL
ncbi:MAG: hypothetical protein IKU71_06215 [Kiritimatiellae bacterium]|nr:hypothetical protein [Kiritimatiellia bacterium]